MGILDSIVGQVLGNSKTQNNLFEAVVGLLGNQKIGGLAGLIEQFAGKGLGDIANSWISTGQNLPISPEQIQQGLGDKTIAKLSSQVGISAEEVTSKLSQLLPQVIDQLTPDGKIPQGDLVSKGMELLKGLTK